MVGGSDGWWESSWSVSQLLVSGSGSRPSGWSIHDMFWCFVLGFVGWNSFLLMLLSFVDIVEEFVEFVDGFIGCSSFGRI